MLSFLKKLRRDERGATAIEYGLVVAVIALGLVATMTNLRTAINTAFTTIGTDVTTTANSAIP